MDLPLEEITIPKKYDVFITKTDDVGIVREWCAYEEHYLMNIPCVYQFKVECVELLDYTNNYKLVNGALVELTEQEKPVVLPILNETEVLQEKVRQQEDTINFLMRLNGFEPQV